VEEFGILDIGAPGWVIAFEFREEHVSVFWGFGVTPQNHLLEIEDDAEGVVLIIL